MLITLCTWIWRVLIAVVFLSAAYAKWRQGISYMPPETIYDRLVAFSPWRHYAMLGVETLIGTWVLSALKPRWSSIATGALLLVFTVMLGAEIYNRSPMLCGCGIVQVFPDGDPRVDLALGMVRNAVLMAGCAWIFLLGEDKSGAAVGQGR